MKRRLLPAAIVLLLVAGLIVTTADKGGLGYFSPHALEEHSQSELTICMIGVPFYRSPRREFKNPLLQLIVKKGYATPQPAKADRWILISHWNESWRDGDGNLYQVLHTHRLRLIEWTEANPECAKLCWGEAIRLLRSARDSDHAAGETILQLCTSHDDVVEIRGLIRQVKDEFGCE